MSNSNANFILAKKQKEIHVKLGKGLVMYKLPNQELSISTSLNEMHSELASTAKVLSYGA
jgi:hypothetical protein